MPAPRIASAPGTPPPTEPGQPTAAQRSDNSGALRVSSAQVAQSRATGTALLGASAETSWITGAERLVDSSETPRLSSNKLCATCGGRYPDDFNVCPRDATPLAWSGAGDADPFLGTTLAETYRVVRVLGEGGMGRVYEVHHTRLPHRRFALKMLHPEFARQPDIVHRFQLEAEAASRVNHPNVIDVYDVGRTQDGRPYLVSELLEGEDLGALLKREGKFEVGIAVHIVRQVCRGLAAAHAYNVVHRDMKPENLFLGAGDRPSVKVLDFGISKMANSTGGTHLTRTGVIMGTPAYMAPEQARGERVDQRADIYAVGAILYRLLTGRTPFVTDDPGAAITAVLTELPPRPRSLAPEIPEALELVIERAMAKRADQRFATMAEFDDALEPFERDPALNPVPVPGATSASFAYAGPGTPSALTSMHGSRETTAGVTGSLARATRKAQMARPALVIVSLLACICLVLGLTECIASSIALVMKKPALGALNAILVFVSVVALTLTPFALYVRYLVRTVWQSTVEAIRVSSRLRAVFLVGMASYGGFALFVRFLETVVYQAPGEVAWAGWGVLWFTTSVVAAASAVLFSRLRGN